MFLTIVILPLLSCVAILCFTRLISFKGVCFISTVIISFSFFFSLILALETFFYKGDGFLETIVLLDTGFLFLRLTFLFDSLAIILIVLVTLISFLVHLYSVDYMREDPHLPRFFAYLSIFTFFMLILVTSNNLFQLFVGWEGVGLCSFLLISFWFTRTQANSSALKAFLINRVGDFGFSCGLFLTFFLFSSLENVSFNGFVPLLTDSFISILGFEFNLNFILSFSFFCGVASKSAQFFLHTWLPDAMEGPTPVSALIHAATMVAAGVFLLSRFSSLFSSSAQFSIFISLIGLLTSLLTSVIACVQFDLKKIIAYSTCSQLGFMVASVGLGGFSFSIFHLVNHAFF